MTTPIAPPVRGRRRIPIGIIYVVCYDWWGEIHCWRHSRRYRALCREYDDMCGWEVMYAREGSIICPVVH